MPCKIRSIKVIKYAVTTCAALLSLSVYAEQTTSNLEFSCTDQDMWDTGSAFELSWREDFNDLVVWDEVYNSPVVPFSVGTDGSIQFVELKIASVGSVGLSPYVNINGGQVDLDYSVDVNIDAPEQGTVKAGETFTLSSSLASPATGSFNTKSPMIDAGVDILFSTKSMMVAGITTATPVENFDQFNPKYNIKTEESRYGVVMDKYGSSIFIGNEEISSSDVYTDGRLPGIGLSNEDGLSIGGQQLKFDTEAIDDELNLFGKVVGFSAGVDKDGIIDINGYGQFGYNAPYIETTSTQCDLDPTCTYLKDLGINMPDFYSSGEDDLLYANMDLDNIAYEIATDAMGIGLIPGFPNLLEDTLPLHGFIPVLGMLGATIDVDYNFLDITPFADINLQQNFMFNPEDLMVSYDLGNGTSTGPVRVGEEVSLIMPEDGIDITPTFSLPDNIFYNTTSLGIDLGIDFTAFDIKVDFGGLMDIVPDIQTTPFVTQALLGPEYIRDPILWDNAFKLDLQDQKADKFRLAAASSTAVPEPSSLIVLSMGLFGLAAVRRSKKQR